MFSRLPLWLIWWIGEICGLVWSGLFTERCQPRTYLFNPHYKQDIDAIERVQCKFTKRLHGLGHLFLFRETLA